MRLPGRIAFGLAALGLASAIPAAGAATGPAAAGASIGRTAAGAAAEPRVLLVPIEGAVDPLVARFVERGLRTAAAEGDAAVVVRIDTPGGLMSSMRAIIQAILASPVPVVCYVGPPGARAASAGAFILIGCPVAAMAPGTNVGAAHPVGLTGEILAEKVTNDAAAYIRSLAERFGRNADWAERAVRESVSVSASEAARIRAADLMAGDVGELLRAVDGREVVVAGGTVTLRTAGARVVQPKMTLAESALHGLVDPNLAYLLFIAGLIGIVLEILHPGITVPGVAGVLALITSLVILGMLPVNLAGLLLILLAVMFFVVDLKVAGHGLPTAAGIISLVLGGLFLFDRAVPNAQVSTGVAVGVGVAGGLFFATAVRAMVRARRQGASAGLETIVGQEGVVERALSPAGIVRARGESWTATASGATIAAGSRVRVVGVKGLTLLVEPLGEEARRGDAPGRDPGTEVGS